MQKSKMVATVNTPKDVLIKKFENEVKNYLSMTTDYTKCYEFDGDNFKINANYKHIEIEYYGNRITFYRTGEVKACYANKEIDLDKFSVFKDIMASRDEMWMMYDGVFNFNKRCRNMEIKELVDFEDIYHAVEKAFELLANGAEFKINNNYSVIWNDGSSENEYRDNLVYWKIDLLKNGKFEKSYCLMHFFNLYVELLRGDSDIVGDIASSIKRDINNKNI